jgi:hypothetical protein
MKPQGLYSIIPRHDQLRDRGYSLMCFQCCALFHLSPSVVGIAAPATTDGGIRVPATNSLTFGSSIKDGPMLTKAASGT